MFEDCESINYLGVKLNFSNGPLEILPPKHRVYVTEIGERTTLCPCAKHRAYSAKCATCLPFSPFSDFYGCNRIVDESWHNRSDYTNSTNVVKLYTMYHCFGRGYVD